MIEGIAMTYLTIFFLIVLFMSVVMHTRIDLVFKMRMKALDLVSERAKEIIDSGGNFRMAYRYFDSLSSYDRMVWSLNKWKFDDFYPTIGKDLMAIGKMENKHTLTVVK